MKKTKISFLLFTILFFNACKKDEPKPEPEERHIKLSTEAISNITNTTAQSGGNITDDGGIGITARGVCYSTSTEPTTADNITNDGTGTGSFTSNLTGLSPNTTYYVRAYAANANGTVYGNELQFTTTSTIPTLSTEAISNIAAHTATSGGNITDDGGSTITARGVCYSISPNPTIGNNTTNDGNGTGSFTSNLTGLSPNTTYYLRAYATNANGTAYGNELQFTTTSTIPTITTHPLSNITAIIAKSGGNVADDGGSPVTARGICFSTNPNPTTADNITSDGFGIASFTSHLTGLSPNTTYYVRAYAINANGTAYGNELSFSTPNYATFPAQTISIAGGTFMMGSPSGTGAADEHPQHSVTVNGFSISKYEITNQQYANFMNAIGANANGIINGVEYLYINLCQINYSGGYFVPETGKENYPVIEITWYGAKAYSEYYGGRLPTEAEWEFAARGGNSSLGYTYSGSNTIDNVAWYWDNSDAAGNSNLANGHGTFPVGTKNANELGIYDMSGNVAEWCNDWYDSNYYSNSPSNNPQGPSSGTYCIIRGGSWFFNAYASRVVTRIFRDRSYEGYWVGFRPVFP